MGTDGWQAWRWGDLEALEAPEVPVDLQEENFVDRAASLVLGVLLEDTDGHLGTLPDQKEDQEGHQVACGPFC